MAVHLIPDESRRRHRLRLGMGHAIRSNFLPNRGAWTTEELDGVALWEKPGDRKPSALQSLWEPPILVRSFGRHLPRAIHAFSCGEKCRPEEDHWYLDVLGVRTDRQGQGVGSSLVRAGLIKVDEAGLPAFLISSNPRNLEFYERFGFAIVEERKIGPGSVWPMLRPPS